MNEPEPVTTPVKPANPFAGLLLAVMLALSIGGALFESLPMIAAASFAWLALIVCWRRLSRQQQLQALVLLVLGVMGLWWGVEHGVEIELSRVLGQNQIIISMMASVTLLRLLSYATDDAAGATLPTGRMAYNRSVVGVHLFAAVINVSSLVIMADRLSRSSPLSKDQALMLGRSFTMAVFYSPFIAGMALALAYTPGSSLSLIMLTGIPLAAFGLAMLYVMGRLGWAGDLQKFPGYPAQFESLWLPGLLAVLVLLLHTLFPSLSVLVLVIMLAPIMVATVLAVRQGPRAALKTMLEFGKKRLPEMGGELALFLAAGVLGAGLIAVVTTLDGSLPFDQFTATEASLILLATAVVAFTGVHPVVMVTTAATVMTPLHPDPNLLAMAFVTSWGIGCALCPFSGTNLVLHGRYGVSSWFIARNNIGFAAAMITVAVILMHLFERFGPAVP